LSAQPARAGGVQLHADGDVLWAVIDRQERRNAVNGDVLSGFEGMLATAHERRAKVVVIRGAGGTFCSGADLHELLERADDLAQVESFMRRFGSVLEELEGAPWATLAVVEGHAVAGGCELLLASDIVVAATTARIGDGHVNYGLVPAGGASVRLPRAVGPTLARYLLLTGELLTGSEAAQFGLATVAVEPDVLDAEVRRIVARLCSRGRATLRFVKTMLAGAPSADTRSLFERELGLFVEHVGDSPDARLGLLAFRDGVTPSFDGQAAGGVIRGASA
jgi:enoyl-CoA hydratase/carnithine racemase